LPWFWDALRDPDLVFFRGLCTLINADMLRQHYEFNKEAIVLLYIALNTSFSMVRRPLQVLEIKEPSAYDPALWLHEHFDASLGLWAQDETGKDLRIVLRRAGNDVAPANKYGDRPYAPITHDDTPHLCRSL